MSESLHRALIFAAMYHEGQDRDGDMPLPYTCHPVEVTQILHAHGERDETVLVAALLHDTLEDTKATAEQVEETFGPEVAQLVGEVTREEPSKEERKGKTKEEIWEMRNQMLLDEIHAMSPAAQRIKMADRISNVREGARTRPHDKLVRYIRQTRQMLDVLDESANPTLYRALVELTNEVEAGL